ncbi:MAG TPA: triose-phosphate isomerase [Gammaproteobacteria bacterium]|nr:triose-phosphate isomerase [Xanthomonadales bacterium]HOP23056.1 triose-phosphate isomerase [Gammaproteobacteria bacterium]HPQ86945.1 triose-phosphate isomerase [Gammaproteobacteria bacterium]
MSRKLLVAGNWKLNGSVTMTNDLISQVISGLPTDKVFDVAVFPPFPYIAQAVAIASRSLSVGAQTVSEYDQGAYTGEVSATMIKELGCDLVLVGHSERREYYHESNEDVAKKFAAAIRSGLVPVLCCGETLEQREAGVTESVVADQVNAVIEEVGIGAFEHAIIAYEPVWAIGTGKTATSQQAQEVHEFIRGLLREKNETIANLVPLLYGGSVKGSNAEELFSMQDIDGGLIGGASLTPDDFLAICKQAEKVSRK